MKRTITRNGQSVDCYGIWKWDSNAVCVWETDEGGEDGYFVDGAKTWEEPAGTLSYDDARKHLNMYTTTLHSINSGSRPMDSTVQLGPHGLRMDACDLPSPSVQSENRTSLAAFGSSFRC